MAVTAFVENVTLDDGTSVADEATTVVAPTERRRAGSHWQTRVELPQQIDKLYYFPSHILCEPTFHYLLES